MRDFCQFCFKKNKIVRLIALHICIITFLLDKFEFSDEKRNILMD